MKTFLFLIFLLATFGPEYALASKQLTCKLGFADNHWVGPCGKYNGQRLSLDIRVSESISSGDWRSDMEPGEVWAGMMDYGESVTRPVEIEHYENGVVFARSMFGWLKITGWSQSRDAIELEMHTGVRVAPSKLDYRIVQRAGDILASADAWNREDNRNCPQGAAKWSIYCAIIKASIEVSGGWHHRRPALEVIRKIVQGRSESRRYKHPLMEYNNDKRTRIEDVHSLFNEARETISQSLLSGDSQ